MKMRHGDTGTPAYVAGLRFRDISSGEIVRLKDYMRLNGVPDDRTVGDEYGPAALRFHIKPDEKAVLARIETLAVSKISKGGMLIRGSSQLDPEARYSMRMCLADEANPIMITGRIASVIARAEDAKPLFDIGVEFLAMEADDRTRLDRFINLL